MKLVRALFVSGPLTLSLTGVHAGPSFVNGLTIPGDKLDASGGMTLTDGRLGFFSDIYYDPNDNVWYALSDRGPGGGTLSYETRIHRFSLDVDTNSGAISNFQVLSTTIFRDGAVALNGLAPNPPAELGVAFDPEGVVVSPKNGHLLVSDEYGPSLYEINKPGQLVRPYETPTRLLPRNAATGDVNYVADGAPNTAGRRFNRGFEGLAASPDGKFAYAMLQSAMVDEGGSSGVCNRIVKFSTGNGRAVAQYAYRMEGSSQGRGISALVAINDNDFLVLERNNRGLGVDGELTPINKKVFRISLSGASDVSNVQLPVASDKCSAHDVMKITTPWIDFAAAANDASLALLGGLTPEKWEGLTIGPKLNDGSYLVLAGTDNDYSATQLASGAQKDVYFKPGGTPVRIACDIASVFANCREISATGGAPGNPVGPNFDFSGYNLIPGVLHAYKASAADLPGLVRPKK
jgi:hypothetical protein